MNKRKKKPSSSSSSEIIDQVPINLDWNGGEFVPPDGGWGWVVCAGSLWTNGIVFGILNTYGILYVAMLKRYARDDPNMSFKTSWVGSVCIGMTFLMSIVASILADWMGIRKVAICGALVGFVGLLSSGFVKELELLYLTFGIFLGLGSAFTYSPSLVILGHYFKKNMGLVNGIVSCGSAIFTVSLSLALPKLLSHIGLKYTLIFLSGLQLTLILCALTWKPLLTRDTNLAHATLSTESIYEHCHDCYSWTRRFLNVNIWRNRGYIVWAVSCGISLFGYFIPFVHLMKYSEDVFPNENGPILLICLNFTSGLGRLVFGKVADLKWVNRIRMQQLAFVIFGVTTMCIPFAKHFTALIIICLVMGICDGIFICLLGPIAFDIVGPSGASQAIGFLLGIFSLPLMCGPPLGGLLYDHLGSYNIAFHAAGTPPILGALIMFFIPKVKQHWPPVTEAEEFAGVSLTNIFDQADKNQELQTISKSPAASELIVVRADNYIEPNYNLSDTKKENGANLYEKELMLKSDQLSDVSV